MQHRIVSVEPDGQQPGHVAWTCACGTHGSCEEGLAEQVTSDHVTRPSMMTLLHVANLLKKLQPPDA